LPLSAESFVQEHYRGGKNKRCEVCRVLEQLDEHDRTVLEDMLARPQGDLRAGAIAAVLQREGFERMTHQWVHSHREKCL
jgi:hypothetical protein